MSKRKLNSILITGGSGFIGSNLIRYLFSKEDFKGKIINLDALTYAGNPENLKDVDQEYSNSRYSFVHGDINDTSLVNKILRNHDIDTVIHLASESHVDRSILGVNLDNFEEGFPVITEEINNKSIHDCNYL